MTMMLPKFKIGARAAVLALALAAGTLASVPAQAQQGPAFNFNLTIPGGQGGFTFGQQGYEGRGYDNGPRHRGNRGDNYGRRCLSDREVRRSVEAYGYQQVEITGNVSRDRVEVVGQKGNWLYSMRVDKCTGEVSRVERIRRMQGGGFGLQFNFGN